MELAGARLRIITWWDMAEGGEFALDLAVNDAEKDLVWDYRVHEKSASGVVGRNATGVDPEAGRRILTQAIARLKDLVLRGIREEPPCPVSGRPLPAREPAPRP